jgi:Egh16-like virulence factor
MSQLLIASIGNAGIISQNLTVTNNVPGVNGLSQGKTQNFNITVAMPSNLACTGGLSKPSIFHKFILTISSINWQYLYCEMSQQRRRWTIRRMLRCPTD